MLTTYVQGNHADWDLYLPQLRFALNTTEQSCTKFSPHFITFGTEPRVPFLPEPTTENVEPCNIDEYTSDLRRIITQTADLVKHNNREASLKQKQHYDRGRRDVQFKEQQLVWCKATPTSNASEGISAKFQYKYNGPYRITKKLSPLNYELTDPFTDNILGIRHVDQLKLYYGELDFEPTEATTTSSSSSATDNDATEDPGPPDSGLIDSQETIIYDPEEYTEDPLECAQTPCTNEDDTTFVMCDKCSSWTHASCAKVSPEIANEIDFYCAQCQPY